ncbi:MAG: MATE family efflux transporter, partial [Oscillospiraceae bacterium]|nr:MATE family efflux transporter [Oscillospiraceae bacterium]
MKRIMGITDFKRVMNLFWPVFAEQVLGAAVGVISTAMVSGLSGAAVAGVGLVSALNFVVMNLFIAVSTGTTVMAAQYMGGHDIAAARRAARQSLALVTYIGVTVGILLLAFERPLIEALFGGAERDVLDAARV